MCCVLSLLYNVVIVKNLKMSNGLRSDGFNLRMTENNKKCNGQKIGQIIVYNTLLNTQHMLMQFVCIDIFDWLTFYVKFSFYMP
jgi:hypothetical protein